MSDIKMNDKLSAIWDQLIAKVESDPGIWLKPWFMTEKGESIRPSNFSTGRKYSGFNIFMLEITRQAGGFTSSKWITFNQCAGLGGSVIKGSKGAPIIVFSPPKYKEDKDGKREMIRPPFFGSSYVFNIEQTTLKEAESPSPAPSVTEPVFMTIQEAEDLIIKTGAIIIEKPSDRAYYSPGADHIVIPSIKQFKSVPEYYGTKFHELIHWSGHESRLNRLKVNAGFGSDSYAREELIAEIGSVFLKTETGINDGVDNAARYIKNWWSAIKEDKGSLIDACAKAQKASDYILNGAPKKEGS